MIFYFSGTGNSKWIAEQIGSRLDEKVVNIAGTSLDQTYNFSKEDRIGIVFPVYAWRAPVVVTEFVTRIKQNGAYTFAICTCAEEAGYTMDRLAKTIGLNSGYSIVMPNNYTLMKKSDVDEASRIKEKIETAKQEIEKICTSVKNKKDEFHITVGKNAGLKTNLIAFFFNRFSRKTDPFEVDTGACIGCGLCQMICPARAITLKDGHPVWTKKECHQCLGCLNRCPVRAINYGDVTKSKGRYHFEG